MCDWLKTDEDASNEDSGFAFILAPLYNAVMWVLLKLSRIIER